MKQLLVLLAFGTGSLFGFPTPQDLEKKIDSLMARYSGKNVPGAAVAVYKDKEVFLAKGYGLRELENPTKTTITTNYRLASLTKAFTATATMLLVENGELSLEQSLQDIFPGFPNYGKAIKVRHLLSHTSGIRDYESLMDPNDNKQITDAGVFKLLSQQSSSYFPPGTRFRYSNSGYVLLSHITNTLTQQPFYRFLEESLFLPLKMLRSVVFVQGENTVPERAYGYSPAGNSFSLTDQSATSATLGDGGIYSSVADLHHWYLLWTGEKTLLSPEGLALMTQPATLDNGEPTGYGFGWYVDSTKGRKNISHTGSTIGQKHALSFFPDDKWGVVVLVNRENASPWNTLNEITRFILQE